MKCPHCGKDTVTKVIIMTSVHPHYICKLCGHKFVYWEYA